MRHIIRDSYYNKCLYGQYKNKSKRFNKTILFNINIFSKKRVIAMGIGFQQVSLDMLGNINSINKVGSILEVYFKLLLKL